MLALGKKLNISNAILYDEVKKWENCHDLVQFFSKLWICRWYSYENFIKDHTESLRRILEAEHNNNKSNTLLSEFAQGIKAYLLHPAVDKILGMRFSKGLKELDATNERGNLHHEGLMTALLVAYCSLLKYKQYTYYKKFIKKKNCNNALWCILYFCW